MEGQNTHPKGKLAICIKIINVFILWLQDSTSGNVPSGCMHTYRRILGDSQEVLLLPHCSESGCKQPKCPVERTSYINNETASKWNTHLLNEGSFLWCSIDNLQDMMTTKKSKGGEHCELCAAFIGKGRNVNMYLLILP